MNVLEQYIKEIHSVEPTERKKWMKEDWVKVDITTNCYGNIQRTQRFFPESEWEKVKSVKYKVSGMFQCDVEADTDAEAEWEALKKIKEGKINWEEARR